MTCRPTVYMVARFTYIVTAGYCSNCMMKKASSRHGRWRNGGVLGTTMPSTAIASAGLTMPIILHYLCCHRHRLVSSLPSLPLAASLLFGVIVAIFPIATVIAIVTVVAVIAIIAIALFAPVTFALATVVVTLAAVPTWFLLSSLPFGVIVAVVTIAAIVAIIAVIAVVTIVVITLFAPVAVALAAVINALAVVAPCSCRSLST